MTDFYSVLKTSIIKRNLRSPAERHEVYDQAREAMIRKLWTLDPPLSEDEVDARIGLFDAAVERIEADLGRSFTSGEGAGRQQRPARSMPREPVAPPFSPPPVYESYDEDADYAPAPGERLARRSKDMRERRTAYRDSIDDSVPAGRPAAPPYELPRGPRPGGSLVERAPTAERRAPSDDWSSARRYGGAESGPPAYPQEIRSPTALKRAQYDDDGYGEPAREEGFADDAPDYRNHYQLPALVEAPAPEVAYEEAAYRDAGYDEPAYPEEGYRQQPYDEPAYYEDGYPDDRRHAPTYAAREARRRPDDFPPHDPYPTDVEPRAGRHQGTAYRPSKRGQGKAGRPSRRGGGKSVPILAIAVGTLALVLIAFNAYVFLPIIFGTDPSRSVAATSPTKVEDRLPTFDATSTAATRIVSDSATATEIPERNLNVAESLVIFNGNDPTVFEGSSNNPIQFDSDSEGGFARISSAASAAGSRAVIGPGLADRLAGRTVRVTLLARSSDENGARTMRFAYQSGLAVSHWQTAELSSNYGTYGMIWRVPAADTAAGDYLLIEPGIPGDGTSTDIRMIKIDILTS